MPSGPQTSQNMSQVSSKSLPKDKRPMYVISVVFGAVISLETGLDPMDWLCRLEGTGDRHHWGQTWRHIRQQKCSQVSPLDFVQRKVFDRYPYSQFNTDDLSLLAVLKYAVDHLGVEHGAFFLLVKSLTTIPTHVPSFSPPSS